MTDFLVEIIFIIILILIPGIYFAWYSNSRDPRNAIKSKKKYFIHYRTFWKSSFDFRGTTKRKDFWITQFFLLLQFVYLVILGINISAVNECFSQIGYFFWWCEDRSVFDVFWFIQIIKNLLFGLSIITFIPSISIQVRRLRDAAKNPWWILISFVPFIGGIVLLIFYLSPSRKKRLPLTLQDRLSEVEDLLKKGTIDEGEYKYMRKKILTKYVD